MIVTLLTRDRIYSITLPEKVRGQYWLKKIESGELGDLISIEAVNDEWVIKSNKKVSILDSDNQELKSIIIKPMNVYKLMVNSSNEYLSIFTELSTDDRKTYSKYFVDRNVEIYIGRNENKDIIVNSGFVSSNHATLRYRHGQWSIYDTNSANKTYINGKSVSNQDLNTGDVVYIMGVKLIVGTNFFAINNPDNRVELVKKKFYPYKNQEVKLDDNDEDEANVEFKHNYFFRSPRFKRDVENAVFKIDPPPQSPLGDELPMILVIGPSMTMGMASMTTALFAVNNAMATGNFAAAMPSIIMSSSMLLGTVLWPILSKKFEKRRKLKREALRQEKYKEYLERISVMFNEECKKQEEILRENIVPIDNCLSRIVNIQRNLWERGPGQNDFLTLRVGRGVRPLIAEIKYAERKFTLDEDNLQEELLALCEEPKLLRDVPITLSLFEEYITGVIGNRNKTLEFTKGLVFQLASLYSYDEVKLIFIYNEKDEVNLEFAKWLPHVWSNENDLRLIATNSNEVKEISAYIDREIEKRSEVSDDKIEDMLPYYAVFAFDKDLSDRAEFLNKIYSMKKNRHFSVVHIYDELKNLPKECSMIVELTKDGGALFDKNDISGKVTSFSPDIFLTADAHRLSVGLSNVYLDSLASSGKLPKMITFLEMFEVGKVEHLNALTRWKENDPTISLEAAVGVDTMGEVFRLDLHEKYHGPHGLVAGMTGSGKSEFIITYILSLAVNYHPNEVAFILIDYKGGGMAKSFENLPHTAGIITNLDGAAIKRSLVSIESELKRRQAIFAEASKKVGVSNIDIYKYQRLYREGTVSEPLQHLFIISDEFAELKTQQPEFMTQLVSAARIGRSLGIHLILATQKPSGVVDDQIWSNSRFRVCLKVQERADSMDMLKRPDAAELTDTGRFYLQVGYNELFEMGQSSWAGASYYPSDTVVVEKDDSVVVIDRTGRPIREVKPSNKKHNIANPQKQLDAVTDYLCTIANEEKIKIRQLWLEPIPGMILLDALRVKYKAFTDKPYVLNPMIGEYDDPVNQKQEAMHLPISQEGNIVVYGAAGSGKTTFIYTTIYSLITNHTPEELNIYILDFASETLRAFSKAPHVGDVVLSFESEKVGNLLKMLKTEIDTRKKLFADYGGDYLSYISQSGEKLPNIVVVVNNYAAFTELYESKEEAVSYLSREGTKYGLFFILTALGTNAVNFRMIQNFKQTFVLQMNDETDYATLLGKTEGLYPSKFKGRGLMKAGELYEFQIAHVVDDAIPFVFLQNESSRLNEEWSNKVAPKIPVLPEVVDAEFLAEYIDMKKSWNVPIGVDNSSLNVYYYPFGQFYINPILSSGNEGQTFLYDLALFYANSYSCEVTMLDGAQAFYDKDVESLSYYQKNKDIEEAVGSIFDMVLYRNNTFKDALESGKTPEEFEQKIIMVNSITAVKNLLSEESAEKLNLILEKGNVKYNITVIFTEQSKNMPTLAYDKWYGTHISSDTGIWVGSGITEQYQLKTNKITSEMHSDVELGFGFAVQNGKARKVKFLSSESEENEDDNK